ncbi:hypothetical protein D1872_345580 [compost metagenome]
MRLLKLAPEAYGKPLVLTERPLRLQAQKLQQLNVVPHLWVGIEGQVGNVEVQAVLYEGLKAPVVHPGYVL